MKEPMRTDIGSQVWELKSRELSGMLGASFINKLYNTVLLGFRRLAGNAFTGHHGPVQQCENDGRNQD